MKKKKIPSISSGTTDQGLPSGDLTRQTRQVHDPVSSEADDSCRVSAIVDPALTRHDPAPTRHVVEFTVPGTPVPKGRPRFGQGSARTPDRTRAYEQLVSVLAKAAHLEAPTFKPVSVYIAARWPRPLRDAVGPPCWRPVGGDLDNVVKAILDGMLGVVYVDDRQVVRIEATKAWAATGEDPGVDVQVVVMGWRP